MFAFLSFHVVNFSPIHKFTIEKGYLIDHKLVGLILLPLVFIYFPCIYWCCLKIVRSDLTEYEARCTRGTSVYQPISLVVLHQIDSSRSIHCSSWPLVFTFSLGRYRSWEWTPHSIYTPLVHVDESEEGQKRERNTSMRPMRKKIWTLIEPTNTVASVAWNWLSGHGYQDMDASNAHIYTHNHTKQQYNHQSVVMEYSERKKEREIKRERTVLLKQLP